MKQVVETIPVPPTSMAVRRMMHILEEKKYLKRRGKGREVTYLPRVAKAKVGQTALQRVLETFSEGSLEEALATHLVARKKGMSNKERTRLVELIEQAEKEGR